ncbi:hypothetical protein PSTG_00543 [Puccinia striiformis f. sp. tritici PST-78]|uniref:Ras-GEF domain-containing protein n=1 Tax=Puccinia striiformis f. sp. tritici PST-78 TaxID=1165861 RepID=A0A0L0W559_9BASI|nr:hypothetical protein PSTG_00543 [Puccinia striiformis f. sp. tritici PST-78]
MLLSLSAPGLKPTATHLPYLYPQVLNLACTQSYVLRKQTRILEFLIKLGAKLLEMQNYNALILVMITPNSFTILLLKRTWEGVGDKAQALFENMNKAVSHQRNYAVVRGIVEKSKKLGFASKTIQIPANSAPPLDSMDNSTLGHLRRQHWTPTGSEHTGTGHVTGLLFSFLILHNCSAWKTAEYDIIDSCSAWKTAAAVCSAWPHAVPAIMPHALLRLAIIPHISKGLSRAPFESYNAKYLATLCYAHTPCIVFLGVYLTDPHSRHKGNPTHCASPELPGVQIIDFDKYQKMMKIMDEIECFQVKFNFLEVSSITAYIHLELHATRRSQLDAIGTDYALQAIETILSSNLGWNQYDIVSAAQIESLAKLAEIWASANPFLSVADGRSRNISSNQLIELGEHHNKVMDARAKKLTCHGSFWAALLGANLLFAFTNGLYAIAAVSRLSPKLNKTLAMERVNGSSTALIQAHRDSVREGYNLAFSPDLVTNMPGRKEWGRCMYQEPPVLAAIHTATQKRPHLA